MRAIEERVTHADRAFRYIHFETDRFGGPWHRHPQLELTWVRRGCGMRFVGDSAAPFDAGDMVLLGANVPHLWMGSPASDARGSCATAIQFPAGLVQQAGWPELQALRPLLERAGVGLRITGACRLRIATELEAMRTQSGLRRLARLIDILGCLDEAADELIPIGHGPAPGIDAGRGDDQRIQRLIEHVRQHLHEPLPVRVAAALVHVAPASFSRFFHLATGRTYSAYVNELRCSAACLQLRTTGRPIARIAEACGFRTLSNFNRRFRCHTGMTPGAYRKRA
ncbi:MAG: helix-turn-helix domain-containing protein [Burkholderiales bacterium]|nr:AraC family transcriptional regulator [Burkholderiales bacterium]MDE1928895.1 helix-turn-helix domain-containing protein [Burkholderiales bacterium]MDE2159441.1 helix-turn-helix domain-containing protein [Burkholderiales bacterium]MDE2502991.1 helix-turn-helix domain-containing protein [Burkholderiales bacterium]